MQRRSFSLWFQKFPDLGGDDTLAGVGAVRVAAIRFREGVVLCHHGHHPAAVHTPAVAGEEAFLFHAHSSRVTQKPMGARDSQVGAKVWMWWPNSTRFTGTCQASMLRLT